jgi:hypothetical protein
MFLKKLRLRPPQIRKRSKEMTKFLNVWRMNGAALPTDPAEQAKGIEMMFAMLDDAQKGGQLEFGFFPDGASGYAIVSGETKDIFRNAIAFFPWIESDINEMVPYETGKEITKQVLKAQMEMMK